MKFGGKKRNIVLEKFVSKLLKKPLTNLLFLCIIIHVAEVTAQCTALGA